MEFAVLKNEELLDIDGGFNILGVLEGCAMTAWAIKTAVIIGAAVSAAASVPVIIGVAAGAGIVACGFVAAYGVSIALNSARN